MAARKKRAQREKPIIRPGAKAKATKAATGTSGETPFDNYSVDRLKKIITASTPTEFDTNKLFVEGDHWQDKDGWIGPHPNENEEGAEEMWTEIEDQFTSKNVIKEIVERHANGVLGRAPVWQFVPLVAKPASDKKNSNTEDAVVAELELAVTRWWNKRNVHERIKDGVMQLLWGSRSPFRLYVPPDKMVGGTDGATGVMRAATLEDALDYIFPEVPSAADAAVYEEPTTRQRLGFFITKPIDPETGDPGSKEVVEMTYLLPGQLNPQGKPLTALRVKSDEGDNIVPVDLNGNLTMYEVHRPLLITEQIQQQQRALNLCLSMLPRNVITSGYMERVLLDAAIPGEWERDKDGKEIRFIPDRFHTGAGTTNALVGIDTETADGKTQHASPDIKWRDPSPVKPSIEAAQAIYLVMLEEGKQAHIILSGEALVSGTSREQARSDYDLSLTDSKAPAELMGEWVLNVAVALAEFFMGTPGKYTSKYRPVFQCHTFTGPVTWEERKQNDASVGKTLSQQRAMEMNGVVDVDAVMSQMMNEPLPLATLREAQGKALKALEDAMIPAELAAEMLGLDPKIASAIKLQAQQALEAEEEARAAEDASTPPTPEE